MPSVVLLLTIALKIKSKRQSVHTADQMSESQRLEQEALKVELSKYKRIILFNFSLEFIYPLFAVGFNKLTGTAQTAYAVLLPLIKIVLLNIAKSRFQHIRDLAAESVVFSVEFFNALFASMCMSSTSSMSTSIVIMVVDLAHITYSIVEVRKRANRVLAHARAVGYTDGDIIDESLAFASTNEKFVRRSTRIRHKSSNNIQFTSQIPLGDRFQSKVQQQPQSAIPKLKVHSMDTMIHATDEAIRKADTTVAEAPESILSEEHTRLSVLRETLELMYAIEHVVLVEYVESVIPFIFGSYLMICILFCSY